MNSDRPKVKWVSMETYLNYVASRINENRYGCTSLGAHNIWNPDEQQYWAVHPEDPHYSNPGEENKGKSIDELLGPDPEIW